MQCYIKILLLCVTITLKTKCIEANTLIVGGNDIPITKAPYQAALLINNQLFCGGIIISDSWILTAAHCSPEIDLNTLRIRVGSADYQNGGQVLQAVKLIIHPKYNSTSLDHDAALLQLKTKITTGSIIALTTTEPVANTRVLVSGWGSQGNGTPLSRSLKQVEIGIVARDQCKLTFGQQSITDRMICAGRPGAGTCQGDSGGPLSWGSNLVGIVSWSIGCAQPSYPGVYTNIADSSITNFIRQYVK